MAGAGAEANREAGAGAPEIENLALLFRRERALGCLGSGDKAGGARTAGPAAKRLGSGGGAAGGAVLRGGGAANASGGAALVAASAAANSELFPAFFSLDSTRRARLLLDVFKTRSSRS